MRIIHNISEIRQLREQAKADNKTIGFVPTMGYLHDGHLSLGRQAKTGSDMVIMSIFINEKQFGPSEDYEKYPRDPERDIRLANETGIDILFVPEPLDIYPAEYSTYVCPEGPMVKVLCARSRPDHFKGVCTIVAKLLNITGANTVYFGQKDYQQSLIVEKMIKDLNMDTALKIMPIIREEDGLAMSSRNAYLSKEERKRALCLKGSLLAAEDLIRGGASSLDEVKNKMKTIIDPDENVKIDYIEILNAENLEKVNDKTEKVLVAVAVYVGNTRLIDNVLVKVGS